MSEAATASSQLPLPPTLRGKVLIFIVAYEAERHIARVLERIPGQFWNDPDYHILMIDDASKDRCSAIAAAWAAERGVTNMTVLRNPVNQGYGGNQKLGYRIAIEAGFQFVIMLHGDGQYAPELLPRFVQAWREEDVDVALGTRMHSIQSARKGGMQWYKIAGNRSLTWFQNKVTRQNLSEYHTGYRAYSTRFLRSVPFEVNTNHFHFDTEILLQAFYVEAKLVEFPIPTFYGDEICRVPGMKYAKDVFFATLQYAGHRRGMLCSLRYQNLTPLASQKKKPVLYRSQEMALEELARLRSKRVLVIGDEQGLVAQRASQRGAEVATIESADPLRADIFDFDAVLLLDVLENQSDPENFLLALRNHSIAMERVRQPPAVIVTTPNVAFITMRFNLLAGRFTYAERGILDIRHKRLFTRWSLLRTLRNCGYEIEKYRPVPVPVRAVFRGPFGKLIAPIAGAAAWVWPTMFSFQSLVVCRPLPGIHQLINQSEHHTAANGSSAGAAYTPSSVAAAISSDDAAKV